MYVLFSFSVKDNILDYYMYLKELSVILTTSTVLKFFAYFQNVLMFRKVIVFHFGWGSSANAHGICKLLSLMAWQQCDTSWNWLLAKVSEDNIIHVWVEYLSYRKLHLNNPCHRHAQFLGTKRGKSPFSSEHTKGTEANTINILKSTVSVNW